MHENPYRATVTRSAPHERSVRPRRKFSARFLAFSIIGAMIGTGVGLAVGCALVMFVGFFIFGWPDNDLEGGRQARIDNLQAVQMWLILVCPAIGVVAGAMTASALSRTLDVHRTP